VALSPKSRRGGPETTSNLDKRRAYARVIADEEYDQRRANIVAAGARVMRSKGLQATTMSDIARESGFDRTTVYYYFRDKDEVFGEAIRRAIADLVDNLENLREQQLSPDERLHRALRVAMEAYDRHYPFLYLYFQEYNSFSLMAPALADELSSYGARFETMMRETLRAGIDADLFDQVLSETVVSNLLLGMLNWTHRWYHPGGDFSPEAIADGMWKLVSAGILKPPGPESG
jgi:AcrR family transcriptional regulator